MKLFYKLLAILLGYGLIVASFIVFGSSLSDNVRILDIVVSCVIFTQAVEFLFVPLVNTKDEAQKEVGMMGIHIMFVNAYILLSIGFMLAGMYWNLSFTSQLLMQLGALFVLILGRVFTLHSGDKVKNVYHQEKEKLDSKRQLQRAMDDVMDALMHNVLNDMALKDRLQELSDNVRFVSPSTDIEAQHLDKQFTSTAADLVVMLRNVDSNKDRITETVGQLEYLLTKRRKY